MRMLLLLSLCSKIVQGAPALFHPTGTSEIVLAQPTDKSPGALANWERWNGIASNALNRRATYEREIRDGIRVRQVPGTWTPQGFSSDAWGWYFKSYQQSTTCANDTYNDFVAGHIMKSVVEQSEGDDIAYKYWYNETYKLVPKAASSSQCSLQSGWSLPQCQNSVWDATNSQWLAYNTSPGLGWTANNSSYNGHTVRTVFDCLLKQVVVEYSTVVFDFGTNPVQYHIGTTRYWRFFDNNNFAWFFACPAAWQGPAKLRKRCYKCGGTNPVWDFGTSDQRDPNSDMTWYPTSQIPDLDSSGQTSYTAMYWPQGDAQIVEVEGEVCRHMAASRPGLRHWTARMVEIPPQTYTSINDEVNWPVGWIGYSKRAWSWEDDPFTW